MNYVTDTHSLVWYLTEDPRLSKNAFEVFEGSIEEGIIVIPTIVLAEVMFIAKKGRTPLTFAETLQKIEEYENFVIAPLDADILKVADKIEVDLEMHDRLIVATSLYFKAIIITMDEHMRKSEICSTIW